MTTATDATCLCCNAANSLSESTLETLSKDGTTTCTGCGNDVKLRVDPESERSARASVLTLTLLVDNP